jgi:hypothetical protein
MLTEQQRITAFQEDPILAHRFKERLGLNFNGYFLNCSTGHGVPFPRKFTYYALQILSPNNIKTS